MKKAHKKATAARDAHHSRKQAIANFVLIDVTPTAKKTGSKVPVALTAAAHAQLDPSKRVAALGGTLEERLWDLLTGLDFCSQNKGAGPHYFGILDMDKRRMVHLKAYIERGYNAEPFITIKLERED